MSTSFAYEDDYDDPDYGRHLEPLAEPGRGCCFPGRCLTVGDHDPAECVSAEMVEEYERNLRKEQ